jgi:hypothetical protein
LARVITTTESLGPQEKEERMFEIELQELQRELDAIAAGAPPPTPDWRKTKILNNEGGILADARKFLDPDWWKRAEPRDERGEILALLKRAGLGKLRDGMEEENVHAGERGVTASEVAEHQHNKQKVAGTDEGAWRSYLGDPKDDARAWLKKLSAQVDMNVRHKKGWWGTLCDHVHGKPTGAKVRDLDPRLVELCLKNLCED